MKYHCQIDRELEPVHHKLAALETFYYSVIHDAARNLDKYVGTEIS